MSAIDPDLAQEIFDGIQKVRNGIPSAKALAELIDPKDVAIIEGVAVGLDKLFELVSTLLSHDTVELSAEALRAQTVQDWKDAYSTK